jgi:DNA-binding NarL/FixJ family response regulator
MEKIRLAVIDNHDLFREGILLVLQQLENLVVVNEARSGSEFLHTLTRTSVDVALMDIEMPGLSGEQTTIFTLQVRPGLKIIALSMFLESGQLEQMIRAGVHGFIRKKSSKAQLLEAINTVLQGDFHISPDILKSLDYQRNIKLLAQEGLTKEDFEVMHLIFKGYTLPEIALQLSITATAAELSRTNLFAAAGVRNTAGLVAWAIKSRYIIVD